MGTAQQPSRGLPDSGGLRPCTVLAAFWLVLRGAVGDLLPSQALCCSWRWTNLALHPFFWPPSYRPCSLLRCAGRAT